jgi:PTH1 family peptidyl-tRNA hydrolase
MTIVVGLGNPGGVYARTRHNVGFLAVECLAASCGVGLRDEWPGLRTGRARLNGRPVLLTQPMLFMNRSGEALRHLPFEWVPGDLVVIYDDLDLPVGQIRLRRDGGAGGHRGVASIIERWGQQFCRVRVGVGRPPEGIDAADYVLEPLDGDDLDGLEQVAHRAADATSCLLTAGLENAMNRFNVRALPGAPGIDSGVRPARERPGANASSTHSPARSVVRRGDEGEQDA